MPDQFHFQIKDEIKAARKEAMQAYFTVRRGTDDEANDDSALMWKWNKTGIVGRLRRPLRGQRVSISMGKLQMFLSFAFPGEASTSLDISLKYSAILSASCD
jgi:hypothetical protein